ncbi:MAG: cobalamin biosynthesis protein [Vulcanisaeta sp.]
MLSVSSLIQYYLAALILSIIIDLVIGEPRGPLINIHPVVLCGMIASRLFKPGGKAFGIFLWFISVVPVLIIYYFISWLTILINIIIGIIIYSYILKLTFSIRLMRDYVKNILNKLETNDLVGARSLVQEIVRRNVWDLDTEHLISAVIESMAESFVDGFLSPLFYYALIGLPGALLQRLSNTMDSMVGYRGWPYEEVGWFSATVDTVLNYIPARLSLIIFSMAAALIGLDWRRSVRVAMLYHGKVNSINSGWPMASFAGALNVVLEKVGRYRINDGAPGPSISTLKLSLKLFDVSVVLSLIFISILLIVRVFLVRFFI